MKYKEIEAWFLGDRDFDRGIVLFSEITRNNYYLNNLRRSRRQDTLEYELGRYLRDGGIRIPKQQKTKKSLVNVRPASGTAKPVRPVIEAVKKADVVVPKKLVLRDEFPFLKNDDCPEEFKILVADMITTHDRYVEGHKKLFDVAHKNEAVCFDAAEVVVENYLTNRQIWNELEHYKKTGQILGAHPVFKLRAKQDALLKMNDEERAKRIKNLKRQIKYRENLLKKNRKNENVAQRKKEIQDLKAELRSLR